MATGRRCAGRIEFGSKVVVFVFIVFMFGGFMDCELLRWVSFHAGGPAFPLVEPGHDGSGAIKDEASAADMGDHPALGFFAQPLEAGAAAGRP